MDPITAALNLANRILDFAIKIYEDTPKEIRVQNIKDFYAILRPISELLSRAGNKVGQ